MSDDVPEKRVCEGDWHEEIELKPFEKCPYCNSETYHQLKKFIGGSWVKV